MLNKNNSSQTADRKQQLWLRLIIAIAGIGGFIGIATAVTAGKTQAWDERVLISLRNPDNPALPVGAERVGEAARDVTSLGGFAVLIFVTLAGVIYFRLDDNVRAARFVGLSIVQGFLVSVWLKSSFARPRPDIVPHLTGFSMSSFPSGHAMMSAIVYLTFAWMITQTVERRGVVIFVWSMAMLLTVAIGLSRVYMGVHYLTDVLAGWCAGFAWVSLSTIVARWFKLRT